VNPFGEELATFTMLYQLFGVGYSGWPIKPYSKSLSDQRSRSYMIATGTSVYFVEQLNTVVLGNALHEYFFACILTHEPTIDQ
jgi:hypothetical protein